jgi:hypothetical protein
VVVIAPVIVDVHLNGNATVDVIVDVHLNENATEDVIERRTPCPVGSHREVSSREGGGGRA